MMCYICILFSKEIVLIEFYTSTKHCSLSNQNFMFKKANMNVYNLILEFAFLTRPFICRMPMKNRNFFKEADAAKSDLDCPDSHQACLLNVIKLQL